jgi:hypothetical protein
VREILESPPGRTPVREIRCRNSAQEVENSIGTGEGALAMMGLADPYGRLDLAKNMITNATETGTGTVDGDAVTIYAVTINVENEANQAGLSPEQQTTIDQALTVLQNRTTPGRRNWCPSTAPATYGRSRRA